MAKSLILDGVKIKVEDKTHCSSSCPLMLKELGTCVLLIGTDWCLGWDSKDGGIRTDGLYFRCRPCRRKERK